MKIVAFDIGDVRTGFCFSDPTGTIPSTGGIITAKDDEEMFNKIEKKIIETGPSVVVIGVPFSLKGVETEQTKKVLNIVERLGKKILIPVKTYDERLSSVEAKKIISKIKGKQAKKEKIDEISARIVLEGYLRNVRR